MRVVAVLLTAVLAGSCAGGPAAGVDRESEEPVIAFYLTDDAERSRTGSRHFGGRRIHLEGRPVISDPDVVRASADLRDEGVILDLELRPDAAERMRRVTGGNIGRDMALVIDAEIATVHVIRGEIGSPIQIAVPAASIEESQALVERIRARWPL